MATELKPAIKDGMSQSERYLLSLDPGYFGIDEKDTTDLLKFFVALSGQFNYYNFSNRIEGNWKDFLLSDLDICKHDGNNCDPHVALLTAFLHLYGYLQKPVNQLLKRHLDYYYQEIIGIKPRPERLDRVHLVLEPDDKMTPSFLNKGELLVAEIAGHPEKLLYALENNVQISGAQIKEIKTLFISNASQWGAQPTEATAIKEMQVYKGDYPVWQPAIFLKDQVLADAWPLLGEEQSELPVAQRTMTDANLGLLTASPLFYHEDGEREFAIKFFIQKQAFNQFESHVNSLSKASSINREVLLLELLNQSFVMAITGLKGWIAIDDYVVSCSSDTEADCFIEVKFKLETTEEAIGIYNSKVHGYRVEAQWPVLRFLLNNSSFHHPYTFLSWFIIERITIKVHVKGSNLFKLKNNLGELYSGSPFQPFGPVPAIGAYLDIKNTNIFNRYTTQFSIKINWFDLPKEEEGFTSYYEGYNYPFTNGSFKIQLNSSADAKPMLMPEEQQEFPLFEYKAADNSGAVKHCTTLSDIDFKRIKFDNAPALDHEWETTASFFKQGAVRLELSAPHEAFGHRLYPQVFTEAVMHNAKWLGKKQAVPNQPYVPVIKSLSIDYTLEHSELTNGSANTAEEELLLIHLYPFGYDTFYTSKNSVHNYFVPPPDQESNLLIGLTGLGADQELSILFQLSEENFHHSAHEPEEINWSYLINNKWKAIHKSRIVQDTTNSFINSGIVTLKIPDDIEKENTILNPDLYWLRASLPGKNSMRSKAVALFAQAASAIRLPEQDQFPEYAYTLPPGSVKGFKGKPAAIKEVRQCFPSFNGQPKETGWQYNIRVSERLRHRQRLLSVLDITQAVLDAFPQILMVKCYTADNNNSILPGVDVHLIVIPKEREDGGFVSQEPRVNLSLLYKIKKFVTQAVSGFVKVEVGNPIYEKIMVVARVQFKSTNGVHQSNGYYLNLMNEDIKKHISPWLYNASHDFQIGAEIFVSEIVSYLQNREYIEYITGFSLVHFYKVLNKIDKRVHAQITDTSVNKIDGIKGSVPGAILIPASAHLLTVIDQPAPEDAQRSGIGQFTIGSGLLVSGTLNNEEIEVNNTVQLSDELYDFTVYND